MTTTEILQLATVAVTLIGAGFALRFNVGALNKIVDKLDSRLALLEASDRKRELQIALLTEPPTAIRKKRRIVK